MLEFQYKNGLKIQFIKILIVFIFFMNNFAFAEIYSSSTLAPESTFQLFIETLDGLNDEDTRPILSALNWSGVISDEEVTISESVTNLINKLKKEFPNDKQSQVILGYEMSFVSILLRSINESFKLGRHDHVSDMVAKAINNNIPGLMLDDIKSWIVEFFYIGWAYNAGQIALEAIKNKTLNVTSNDVRAWILECYKNKRYDVAFNIIIEAINEKIPGITFEDIKRCIDECNDKPDILANGVIKAIDGKIPGITITDIKSWVSIFFNNGRGDLACQISIEALKNNFSDISLKENVIRGINESNDKPDIFYRLVMESINVNMLEITITDIKSWVSIFFNSGRGDLACQISIEALKNNFSDISLKENVIRGINESKDKPHILGMLVIEAIKANISEITVDYLKRSINECFFKGQIDRASIIVIEAINSNIPGITITDIKSWVAASLNKNQFNIAIHIAIEAMKNTTLNISNDDAKVWITKCLEFKRPDLAGKIAIEAMNHNIFTRKISKILSMIQNVNDFQDNEVFIFVNSGISYALMNEETDNLDLILNSIQEELRLIPMLERFISIEKEKKIWKEIFDQKSLRSFKDLYNLLYEYLLSDILPDDIDLNNKRINMLLRDITRFDVSMFSKEITEKFEDIYNRYAKDFREGKIKPLPKEVPPPTVIEIATKASQAISVSAAEYYKEIMKASKLAILAIDKGENKNHYKTALDGIITLIDEELNVLEEKSKGIELPEKVKIGITNKTALLKQVKQKLILSIESKSFPLFFLKPKEIDLLSGMKGCKIFLREILFINSFINNSEWKEYFNDASNKDLTIENAANFIEFIDTFIKPELLKGINNGIRKSILKLMNHITFKEERERLIDKKSGLTRKIGIYPTRGWLAEYVGYYSDECWVRTSNIIKDNPDAIVLAFIDEDTKEILGGTLLMPNSIKRSKILIDRGLSPRKQITNRLDVGSFVEQVADFEQKIALALGASGIVVPLRKLLTDVGTNNPDIVEYYNRTLDKKQPVNLNQKSDFNNHDITKESCVIMREFSDEKHGLNNNNSTVASLSSKKTIIFNVISEEIIPYEQREMLKKLQQKMIEEKNPNSIVLIPSNDKDTLDDFMDKLNNLKMDIINQYKEYHVEFNVACHRQDFVEKLQDKDIRVLAFSKKGKGNSMIECIILALRALRTGRAIDLLNIYKFFTGKVFKGGLSDVNTLARLLIFDLPNKNYNGNMRIDNSIIKTNILTAA